VTTYGMKEPGATSSSIHDLLAEAKKFVDSVVVFGPPEKQVKPALPALVDELAAALKREHQVADAARAFARANAEHERIVADCRDNNAIVSQKARRARDVAEARLIALARR
jgi:hypothetical protein